MPANPITALTNRRILNRIVNERIRPYTALTNMIFPASVKENLFEEFAQVDVLKGTYGMAPFVKVGQKSIIVDTLNGTSYTIETPFINIKRPLQYSTKLAKRVAGMPVFTNTEETRALVLAAIAEDVDFMNRLIDDRIEWMVAFLLRGEISYSVEGQTSFIINSGKPAANTFTVSALWSGGSATPLEDIVDMKRVVAARRGAIPNVGICGSAAAASLRNMLETKQITALQTTSGIDTGRANLLSQVSDEGMIPIARIGDVEFFEYLGTFLADGTDVETPLIRPTFIEFFSTSARALEMRKLMFGMIPDLRAIMEGNAVTERYLETKAPGFDQGTYEGAIKTRPFPWFFRPDWNVSVEVAS